MTKKQRLNALREIFDALYPEVKCSLNYTTPVEMLIATQLSAQCTDASVNRVTAELFKKYTSVFDFANADLQELEQDIHSIGLYRNKAKNIKAACQKIISDFNCTVPDTMEELLTLPGTGRKTANLVLGDIYHKPAIVVDTHCSRVLQRIGITSESTPVKIEFDLKKLVPPDYQLRLCHQTVYHGRSMCMARSPKCAVCPVAVICKYAAAK